VREAARGNGSPERRDRAPGRLHRSGRDTFNALKLERQLADAGIPLLAADEPIDVAGMNATTILARRVKQGIAEWYRFQIKEKAWKGLREHTLDGYNIGGAPYGYTPERIPHPVPVKAAQGRTKTRLARDPARAPVVAQIYTWRTVDKLGIPEITARLNTDHQSYPPPMKPRDGPTAGCTRSWPTPSTPGTWCSAAAAPTLANAASPSHLINGYGAPSRPTRRSSPGPPGTPPKGSARSTAPPPTGTPGTRAPEGPTCYAAGSAGAPADAACTAPPASHPGTTPTAPMSST